MTDEDGLRVVGWGPFPMPGEKKRRAASRAYAERGIEARKTAAGRDVQLARATLESTVNLYLVKRDPDEVDWDEYRAHIVAAASEADARNAASRKASDEGSEAWYVNSTTVRLLGAAADDVELGVVLSDHHTA